ncbi:CoA transferase [Rhodococcus sp. T2V]|uniref:CaiB/BaiF CoA transferase family protein n=1 Tax=Rhodococcus sp. T2V TaxID=3034164 RepID=UPI0023E09983|nr:CoA transferase [Rhodococcus sp. T2V]MDF3311851.1 CoA transferase [Rhodococcus sp. T2V]
MESSGGALAGIRVVDFGQYVAGPLVAMILADHGAEVIRVEPPGGPRWRSEANAILQRGKRGVVLDLTDPVGLAEARRLVVSADVVVENFRPGVMERLGLGFDTVRQDNPSLIYCSLPGFASDDPRASVYAHEGVVSAAAGLYPQRDFAPGGEPIVNTMPLASVFAAMIGLNCVVAALIARERTGVGQRIETSLFDACFEITRFYGDQVAGEAPDRPADAVVPQSFQLGGSFDPPTADHYRCADGRWVHLSWLEGRQLETFAELVGMRAEWAEAGVLDIPLARFWDDPRLRSKLRGHLEPIFLQRPAAEWERLVNPDCDLTECATTQEWLLYDEQARATRSVITLPDPELGVTHQLGHTVTMSATPPEVRRPRELPTGGRAPTWSSAPEAPGRRSSGTVASALEGVLVVDTCQLLAGPTVGRILLEYGADVVQVSNPHGRASQAYHRITNGGKRSMSLDLKRPGGLDVFRELLKRADVLSTNFSEAVAERLGIDEPTVRGYRTDIVYSRLSAHGPVGPRAEYRGHEQVGQTVTGMQVRFGKDAEHPIMQPFAVNDCGTGHLTALAIMLALFHRMRTGEGQWVGSSLAQAAGLFQVPYMIAHRRRDWDDPGGLGCRGTSPTEHLYLASDGWFYLGAPDTAATRRTLAGVAGLEGVTETPDLEAALAARFSTASRAVWAQRLTDAGLGAHAWNSIDDAMNDPWARTHGLSRFVEFPQGGTGRLVAPVPRLTATPMRAGTPAPPVGWHTEDLLRELGFGDQIDSLVAGGAAVLPAVTPQPS